MAMIYTQLELADASGKGIGRWRTVGKSDESRSGVYDECCDCDGGHASPQEARDCPKAKDRVDRLFHRDADSLHERVEQKRKELADAEAELAEKLSS